jgi:hypothetical protein
VRRGSCVRCSWPDAPPRGRIGALPPVPQPSDAAEIIVIREARFFGSAHTVSVALDGMPVYGINNNEHVILAVPAGFHLIGVSAGWTESSAPLQALARQRYYFRLVTGQSGAGFMLQSISPDFGQALMAKTKRISP